MNNFLRHTTIYDINNNGYTNISIGWRISQTPTKRSTTYTSTLRHTSFGSLKLRRLTTATLYEFLIQRNTEETPSPGSLIRKKVIM